MSDKLINYLSAGLFTHQRHVSCVTLWLIQRNWEKARNTLRYNVKNIKGGNCFAASKHFLGNLFSLQMTFS